MIEYNYEMEQADQKIEMLARLRLDLIKTIFETEGLDLGNSENNINYRNYLVDSQLMLGFGGFGGESYGLMNLAPSEYDKYIDYNSDDPFANLPGPPEGSGILKYWNRGDVRSKGKLRLTWGTYLAATKMGIGGSLVTRPFTGPAGDIATGRGNGLNNPINLSFGTIAKKYGATGFKVMADKQKNAIFPSLVNGLAASMHFYIAEYHGKNVCQLNNQQQGFYVNDSIPVSQRGIGDPLGMAALRLRWVTSKMNSLNISATDQLNLHDRDTLYASVAAAAKIENGMIFGRQFLDKAYALVQNK
jgi:hypothetical protein